MQKGIVVFGSLNVDFVVTVEKRPAPGETVAGLSFRVHPGGKGANQAVAAARAGGTVTMIGRVGDDGISDVLARSLSESGVRQDLITITHGATTGCAFITVDRGGRYLRGRVSRSLGRRAIVGGRVPFRQRRVSDIGDQRGCPTFNALAG